MPGVKNIFILNGAKDGSLTLSDNYLISNRRDEIQWHLRNNPNVKSIENIVQKGGTDIFDRPPYRQGNHWRADIKSNAGYFTVIEYKIQWTHDDGSVLWSDPKIAVWPGFFDNKVLTVLKVVVVALLTIFGYKLFQHKKTGQRNNDLR